MASADRFSWQGKSGKTDPSHRQAADQLHQNGKALVYRVNADGRQQSVDLCPRCDGGRRRPLCKPSVCDRGLVYLDLTEQQRRDFAGRKPIADRPPNG